MSGDCLGVAVRRHRKRRVLVPGSVASSTSRLNAVRSNFRQTYSRGIGPREGRSRANKCDYAPGGVFALVVRQSGRAVSSEASETSLAGGTAQDAPGLMGCPLLISRAFSS